MKKFKPLALVLALIMLSSMCAVAKVAYVPIKINDGSGDVINLATKQTGYQEVTNNNIVSQRITVDGSISSVSYLLPSFNNNIGTLTVTVYEWKKSIAESIKGKAIGKQNFVNTADNARGTIPVAQNSGDILVHFTNGSDRMGVWVSPTIETTTATQTTFVNGAEIAGCVTGGYTLRSNVITGEEVKTKDAYEFIEPGTRDALVGFTEQRNTDHYDGDGEETYYGMFNVGENSANSYALFKNVDFGKTSPKRILFRIYQMQAVNHCEIQLCLDSVDGDIIGSARYFYDYNEGKERWTEIVSDVAVEVTGIHDVYMVYRSGKGRAVIGKFKFLKDEAPLTGFEKELEDYSPVPDESLTWTNSDTWVATDLLGRKLPDNNVVGDIREGKDIGLFYWTWHAQRGYTGTAISNNQNVVDNYVGDINEIKNKMNYAGWGNPGAWNESVYGHYTGFDTWVMRKQLELLSAAGVDFVATDCSNSNNVFASGHMYLMREMHKMRSLGYNVPKITFILPWSANASTTYDLENLYTGFYGSGLYSDCWYYLDGKPLIMAYPGGDLLISTGNSALDEVHKEISEFFTFRGTQPGYKVGQTVEQQWPWLEVAPQHGFMKKADGSYEIVAVSTAQNSNDEVVSYTAMNGEGVYGRSYTYKDKHKKLSDTSVFYGYNFQEQWDNAFKIDPDIVFITGWNEWIAGHFADGGGTTVEAAYVDQWIDEYSRDIEPTKGQLKDTYYMQMVSNIRKFKGVSPTPVSENAKTVDVKGDFEQWSDVGPEFIGFKGGVEPRNGDGYNGVKYVNNTGRNDIVLSKASHDAEKVYFYAETAEALSPSSDNHWMRLYINADRKYSTGWEGYDYIVNRVSPTADELVVEKCVGSNNSWKWEQVATAPYSVQGNKLMLEIPKSVLELDAQVDIEFKWHDNGVDDGNILDFYTNGDCAPVGRYAYRYVDEAKVNTPIKDEPTDVKTNLDILTRKYVVMALNNPVAYAKGNRTMIDPDNEAIVPQIVNDKTLVPIRFISEGLGANVTWNDSTATAQINLSGTRMVIKEGSDVMKVEKKTIKLQTPAQTINDRMYVPLRDLVEGFGLECHWEDPGLIIIGNGVTVNLLLNSHIVPQLMERFDLQ